VDDRENMCEHCCYLESVLDELVGLKVAEDLMKRVRSPTDDALPSNEPARIGVELC
jgi:hypothetical protein